MTNRSAPDVSVVPVLVYADAAEAIEWLGRVFGFEERLRLERGGVVNHAQLTFRDGAVIIGREGGPFRAPRAASVNAYVHVTVEDVEAHFAHAQACGARILEPPHDMPFGERQYTVVDCGGHRWTFSQHIADIAPEDWGATVPTSRAAPADQASAGSAA